MAEFQRSVQELTHVEVQRAFYNHHYLVKHRNNEGVDIIHYTSKWSASKGKIMSKHLRYNQVSDLFDFTSGLYFITRPEYPSTLDEKKQALSRASSRIDETNYSASINNCEHLVTWILTGEATCEQLKYAPGRAKADLFDSFQEFICYKGLIIRMLDIAIEAFKKGTPIEEIEKLIYAKLNTLPSITGIPSVVFILLDLYLVFESIFKLLEQNTRGDIDSKQLYRILIKRVSSFITKCAVGSFISTSVSTFVLSVAESFISAGVFTIVLSIFSGFFASLLCHMFGALIAGIAFDILTPYIERLLQRTDTSISHLFLRFLFRRFSTLF